MFSSPSRLDLGITVGPQIPQKSSRIKTIPPGPLPILVEYVGMYSRDLTGFEFRRMRTALTNHRDRVREISFKGTCADLKKLFEVTNRPFPVLESLVLNLKGASERKLPDTFLRGPKPSDLHLRRLTLEHALLASVCIFLSSATALTDVSLKIDTIFGPSPETSFLPCLQGMPSLRSLKLSVLNSASSKPFGSLSQPPTPGDIVRLSNLTCFRYVGHPVFLCALVAGFSAPSAWDVDFSFSDSISSPIVHLLRFINEMEGHYRTAQINFVDNIISPNGRGVSFSLLTHSEFTSHCKPHLKLHHSGPLHPGRISESIMQMSSTLSTRLTAIEELRVIFDWSAVKSLHAVTWLRVFLHFPNVRTLRLEGTGYDYMARTLNQEPNDLVLLPALEEIQLGESLHLYHEIQRAEQLAVFQPFVSTSQQAGRSVKVFFDR